MWISWNEQLWRELLVEELMFQRHRALKPVLSRGTCGVGDRDRDQA